MDVPQSRRQDVNKCEHFGPPQQQRIISKCQHQGTARIAGHHVFSGSVDGTVRLWESESKGGRFFEGGITPTQNSRAPGESRRAQETGAARGGQVFMDYWGRRGEGRRQDALDRANFRKRHSKCVNSRTEADDRTRWDRSD